MLMVFKSYVGFHATFEAKTGTMRHAVFLPHVHRSFVYRYRWLAILVPFLCAFHSFSIDSAGYDHMPH